MQSAVKRKQQQPGNGTATPKLLPKHDRKKGASGVGKKINWLICICALVDILFGENKKLKFQNSKISVETLTLAKSDLSPIELNQIKVSRENNA